eukprot:6887679-Prymnesium_polylepis.1
MNASGTGTGVDHRWRNALAKMFKQTPLPKSLKEAIQGLSAVRGCMVSHSAQCCDRPQPFRRCPPSAGP